MRNIIPSKTLAENKMMCRLITPNIDKQKAFRVLVEDFKKNSKMIYPFVLKIDSYDFAKYISILKGYNSGIGLKSGYSPSYTFWLVNKNDEIIGVTNIRTQLTDKNRLYGGHIGFGIAPKYRRLGFGKMILKLSLEKAKEFGINEVLVTCDKDNIGSKNIIEACNGKFENEIIQDNTPVLRYWINT